LLATNKPITSKAVPNAKAIAAPSIAARNSVIPIVIATIELNKI
jgi:hypothetical protein